MSTYIYILGKDRDLSLAELKACYSDAIFNAIGSDFAILDIDQKINQTEFDKMGGVIKAGKLVSESDRKDLVDKLAECLCQHDSGSKLNYGISIYGFSEKNLRSILLDLKKKLKKEDISSRFANQHFLNLSTAQHKGLGQKGVEFIIAKNQNSFLIFEVIAVQDIDSYSMRDYNKPYRNMRVGMLPPKLAQIMINLTGKKGVIWDPFCGGGVLLMEGLLMGHDMLGSDIEPAVIEGAKTNISWLKNEFGVKKKADLFIHDATRPFSGKKFEAISAEGYLGPPQSSMHYADDLMPVIKKLDDLYVDFFKAIKAIKFRGPVVIALPFFRCMGGQILDLSQTVSDIQKIGFRLIPLIPETILERDRCRLSYSRGDQMVGRDIYRFELNSKL